MNKTKRIGIISADINTPMFNYGAILHTWAFEKFLNKEGYWNVENIDYSPELLARQNRLFPFMDLFTHTHRKLSFELYCLHYIQYLKKYRKMKLFFDTNMVNSKKRYNYYSIDKANLDYDILIAEDDVIWAPGFMCYKEFVDRTFFLAHDNMKSKKKISYAASMGDAKFKREDYPKLKEYLSDFDYISVRESYANNLINNELKLKSNLVMDAVFLLEENDYNQIISSRFKNEEKYLLIYIPIEDSKELRIAAEKYANENHLKIIEVSNKIRTYGNVLGDCGIEDFLSAIKYAEIVFTNSFHALCFSLIFKKEFYVFSRSNAGKNKDLCSRLGIEDRYFPGQFVAPKKDLDYSVLEKEIKQISDESRTWLINALEN